MALWILRLIFLLVSAGLAVFIMNSPEMKDGPQWLPWTVLAGAVTLAVAVIGFDWAIRRKDLTVITAVYFGLLIGVFLTYVAILALTPLLSRVDITQFPLLRWLPSLLGMVM